MVSFFFGSGLVHNIIFVFSICLCKSAASFIGPAKQTGICAQLTHKKKDNGAVQEKNLPSW